MNTNIFLPAGISDDIRKSKDTLWLKLSPKQNEGVDTNKRGGAYKGKPLGIHYYFIFPVEFQHNIQHQWEEFDTVAGKLRDAEAVIRKQGRLLGEASRGKLGIKGTGGIGSKNDNPVLYMNSTRREFELTFELTVYSDPKNDVFAPVDNLIKWSLATLPNDGGDGLGLDSVTDVNFHEPHTFSAETVYGNGDLSPIIQLSDCAIINIAPSYTGPYIGGYPSKCSLSMTLKDLNPTYRKYYGTDVNVSVKVRGS